MSQRERLIDLVTKLTAAREHLRGLEAELEQLLAGADARSAPAESTGPRRARGGVTARVLDLLTSEPDAAFTVPQIANRLKLENINALRQAVIRLASLKRIERRSRGAYGAAQKGRSGTPSDSPAKREGWLNRLFE